MDRVRRYRRTSRITLLCGAVLLGLGWSRFSFSLPIEYVWFLFFLTLITYRKARIASVYVFVTCGFALGWYRGGQYMSHIRELESISKDTVIVTGTALGDSVYDDKKQVSFDMGSLRLEEPYQKAIVGKIGVGGYGENMVYRGDIVHVTGKFYPARGSKVAYISFAKLDVTARSNSVIYSITRRFAAGLQNTLPEPLASFALGLLIGQRNTLPLEVSAALSAVGLTHIIAVSGYNMTIMTRAAKRLFGKRSKFQVFIGCEALILSFLLVTGMSASIVRAAIISTITLGAWYYGRTVKPLLVILFTAALTALWSPLYIWSDLGWYLSFLAFGGVLIIAPFIKQRFFSAKSCGILGELVLETISAQVMTLPIILYIFKTSSFIALPANVLVVPLIPLAMLLSFIAGIAGMLVPIVAGWVAWPARIVLTYLLDMATMFSRVPYMQFMVSVSLAAMLVMYGAIVFVIFTLWHKNRQTAKITEVIENTLGEVNVWAQQVVND